MSSPRVLDDCSQVEPRDLEVESPASTCRIPDVLDDRERSRLNVIVSGSALSRSGRASSTSPSRTPCIGVRISWLICLVPPTSTGDSSRTRSVALQPGPLAGLFVAEAVSTASISSVTLRPSARKLFRPARSASCSGDLVADAVFAARKSRRDAGDFRGRGGLSGQHLGGDPDPWCRAVSPPSVQLHPDTRRGRRLGTMVSLSPWRSRCGRCRQRAPGRDAGTSLPRQLGGERFVP